MNRTGKSKAYISVNNESKALFAELKESLGIESRADALTHICKFFIKNYDLVNKIKDSAKTEAQLNNAITPYRISIKETLDNFEPMNDNQYYEDVKKIMWNVDELIQMIKENK